MIGWYSETKGYWETSNTPSAEIQNAWPSDTAQVALRPSPLHEIDGGAWVGPTIDQLKVEKLEELAQIRFEAEYGGFSSGGVEVDTSDRTRNFIAASYTKALADPSYSVPSFKSAPGVFTTLNAAQIIGIGDLIVDHVQACFTNEATISVLINDATNEAELNAIDLNAGWPS
ncbi:MAG: DUF4376 domain-containing protein [Roseobacter sp.]